ncbi:Mu transposase domain-containing protein [Sorangium sp. So ce385]|uniref:Mu transposase domain-containing protein n=1 Tax=Sorangium sp. So ce385 TaxID=3133308 RepID=UPI003F5B5844
MVFDDHFYAVPYAHVHQEVWIRATVATVEVLLYTRRIAPHPRSRARGKHSTLREHMPSAHRAHAEWTPSRLLAWAEKIGPATRQLCAAILAERPHPEQGFRSCLGLLRLGKRYGQERLEAACERAGRVRARAYRHIASILKNGLDRLPMMTGPPSPPNPLTTRTSVALTTASTDGERRVDRTHAREAQEPSPLCHGEHLGGATD